MAARSSSIQSSRSRCSRMISNAWSRTSPEFRYAPDRRVRSITRCCSGFRSIVTGVSCFQATPPHVPASMRWPVLAPVRRPRGRLTILVTLSFSPLSRPHEWGHDTHECVRHVKLAGGTGRSDDGRRIYLDRTAFYPASGGQPHDTGVIAGVPLVDVEDEGERIAHLVAAPLPEHDTLQADEVDCRIDWDRRFDHMQQHSGQHL